MNNQRKLNQTKRILDNEACQMCGKRVTEKCVVCLINNNTAGYCNTFCHREHNHKPIWIGAYE